MKTWLSHEIRNTIRYKGDFPLSAIDCIIEDYELEYIDRVLAEIPEKDYITYKKLFRHEGLWYLHLTIDTDVNQINTEGWIQ